MTPRRTRAVALAIASIAAVAMMLLALV